MCAGGNSGCDAEEVGFEKIYSRAGSDFDAIPWASLAAHPALVAWLDRHLCPPGLAAIVIGSGLGDDAEELSRRGYRVTAFDVSPTAIDWSRRRFPESQVHYQVADLFALPDAWNAAFDLAVEIRTLQSLAPSRRADAITSIAGTVRLGGWVFVRCLARDDDEPPSSRPWPVSRRELRAFTDAGLREAELLEQTAQSGRGRSFTAVYTRLERS